MNADVLTARERQPAGTVAALVRANERLRSRCASLTLPLLIVHGTADRVALVSGSQFLYVTAGATDRTLKLYEGHYHDLLNDIGRGHVAADLQSWIAGRLTQGERQRP